MLSVGLVKKKSLLSAVAFSLNSEKRRRQGFLQHFMAYYNTWNLIFILLIHIPFAYMILWTLVSKSVQKLSPHLKKFKIFSINFKFAANQLPSEFSCASKVNSAFKAELGVFNDPIFILVS